MSEPIEPVLAKATARPIGGKEDSAYPGKINIGGGFFEGHYPGNRCVSFDDGPDLADQINKYFEDETTNVVTGVFAVGNRVLVFYTRFVSQEEIDALTRFAEGVRAKIAEENKKKAELEYEQATRAAEAAKEQTRLAEIGRKCEENHKKAKKNDAV